MVVVFLLFTETYILKYKCRASVSWSISFIRLGELKGEKERKICKYNYYHFELFYSAIWS